MFSADRNIIHCSPSIILHYDWVSVFFCDKRHFVKECKDVGYTTGKWERDGELGVGNLRTNFACLLLSAPSNFFGA